MKVSVLYFSCHQLLLGAPMKSYGKNQHFLSQNGVGNYHNRKHKSKFNPAVTIRAAFSSSPSLGSSASDYSGKDLFFQHS